MLVLDDIEELAMRDIGLSNILTALEKRLISGPFRACLVVQHSQLDNPTKPYNRKYSRSQTLTHNSLTSTDTHTDIL